MTEEKILYPVILASPRYDLEEMLGKSILFHRNANDSCLFQDFEILFDLF